MLEKLVREYRGAVRMVKINVDDNQGLAGQLRIHRCDRLRVQGRTAVRRLYRRAAESQLRSFSRN